MVIVKKLHMANTILKSNKRFWFFIAFLCAVGLMVIYLAIDITIENGGAFSDTPAYIWFGLGVIIIDILRRVLFYVRHKDDQVILNENAVTLIRSGVERKFFPLDLEKIRKRPGSGFLYFETYGGMSYKIQPWLFGKTMGQFVGLLREQGFSKIGR